MNPGTSILEKRVKRPTIFEHLLETYHAAEAAHSDLMEPFAQAIVEAEDREAQARAMRHALAVTFRARHPMPEGRGWPGDTSPASAQDDSLASPGPAPAAVNPLSSRNPQVSS